MINEFALHDTATAPEGSAGTLKSIWNAWGFVPNLHRVLAESPAALEAVQHAVDDHREDELHAAGHGP